MRKLILASASVLVLGIGGAGMSFAADMGNNAPRTTGNTPAVSGTTQYGTNAGANMPGMSGMPEHQQTMVNPSKDEIRQVQQELKDQGLYRGAVDGIMGPETKQALRHFQQKNGLPTTAELDQQTLAKLQGNPNAGMGSSMPQTNQSNLGDHTGPTH